MNVLLIGLGSIGKKHVAALKSIDRTIQIFALRSTTNAELNEDVANIFTLKEIENVDIDFAIIANPTSEHTKTIKSLIEYDFPLFIEKPLSAQLDVDEIISTIQEKGTATYIACNLRFLDSLNYVRKHLTEKEAPRINEINVYCGSYLPLWRKEGDFRQSYSANADLGGGVHIDLIHEIDYLYWLLGSPNEIKRHFTSKSNLDINAVDYANYLLEYERFNASVILNYYRRDAKRTLEIVFDEATWMIDIIKNNVSINGKIVYASNQTIADTYQNQMNYFINCLKEGHDTFNNIENAYNVLKICIEQ